MAILFRCKRFGWFLVRNYSWITAIQEVLSKEKLEAYSFRLAGVHAANREQDFAFKYWIKQNQQIEKGNDMKQKSREVQDIEAKKALRLRIADICVGAAGYNFDDENEWSTAHMLGRMVPALELRFGNEKNRYLFRTDNLEHYETIDSITDFLWRNDVRA